MDAVIQSAIQALKQRRTEIDQAISSLEGVNASQIQTGSVSRKTTTKKAALAGTGSSKRRTMSPAVRAKLRAAYAANHPGWKPKKK
jgi:hypothetical protein